MEDFLNETIENGIAGILNGIKMFFWGISKLKKPKNIILLGFFIIISFFVHKNQSNILEISKIKGLEVPKVIRYLFYWIVLLVPAWFLIYLGSVRLKEREEYNHLFSEIGFKDKKGKYPILLELKQKDKEKIYTFRSSLSLNKWKSVKNELETVLDCTIVSIQQGKSKRNVQISTLDSSYTIPDMIYWRDEYIKEQDGVLTVGESYTKNISFDLNRNPHVLVAGETGSGKSVVLRCLLWQMINKGSKIYMMDFKGGVEFGKPYEKYGKVVTERETALNIFDWLVEENKKRLDLFRELEVKNLKQYNQKTGENLARIGVFVDEIAELMDKKGIEKEEKALFDKIEARLATLARLSRATGINLFLGVQRPDANVLPGQIKNNVPVRISGRFADKPASEIVLGNTSACDLPDIKGRFIYRMGNEIMEFQSYYFDDETMLKDVFIEEGTLLTEQGKKLADTENKNLFVKKKDLDLDLDFDK